MAKARTMLFLSLPLLGPATAAAQGLQPEAELEGFAELRAHASVGAEGEPFFFIERLRPTVDARWGDRLAASATVEAALRQGRDTGDELRRTLQTSDLGPLLDAAGCTWPTDDNRALHLSQAADYLWVDRLYVDAYLPGVDLRAGRQALNWGSAVLVNPTDPFPQVLLLEPWRPRAGVNAVRASVPIADDHRLQLVAGADDALRRPRLAARATANVLQTDVSAVGAWRAESDELLLGADLKGTLGVGWWVEGAHHLRDTGGYTDVAVGLDYSFPVLQSLLVQAQYYRTGAEASAAGAAGLTGAVEGPSCGCDGASPFGDPGAPDPFAPVFTGRDYLLAMVAAGITPTVSASALMLQNLGDGSALVVPSLSWAPRGWLELSATAQVPVRTWGDGGELAPGDDQLVQEITVNPAAPPLTLDLSGLAPDATLIAWTRLSF